VTEGVRNAEANLLSRKEHLCTPPSSIFVSGLQPFSSFSQPAREYYCHGKILGVNQKTAWTLGHAVTELMDDREGIARRLDGVVEVDEAFVGGAPRFRKGFKHKRGRSTKKPIVLVAADRSGQANATIVPNAQGAKQSSRPSRGVHINTIEAVNFQIQRALIRLNHRLGRKHLQEFLDEIIWRWNH
jgi:hypothetical protein